MHVRFITFFSNLGRRVRQLVHVRLKGRMRGRNSVCFESDRGNRATRGKPVDQRGEEHTNSNHIRQTPTVQTRIEPASSEGTAERHHRFATPRPLVYIYIA